MEPSNTNARVKSAKINRPVLVSIRRRNENADNGDVPFASTENGKPNVSSAPEKLGGTAGHGFLGQHILTAPRLLQSLKQREIVPIEFDNDAVVPCSKDAYLSESHVSPLPLSSNVLSSTVRVVRSGYGTRSLSSRNQNRSKSGEEGEKDEEDRLSDGDLRGIIIPHFVQIWNLLPSSRPLEVGLPSSNRAFSARRSAYECEMMLLKLCKVVGISVEGISTSNSVSLWKSPSERGEITFNMFCGGLMEYALLPSLRHYKLDRNYDGAVEALGRIISKLVTTDPNTQLVRICHLNEVKALFPAWRKKYARAPMQVEQTSQDMEASTEVDPSDLQEPSFYRLLKEVPKLPPTNSTFHQAKAVRERSVQRRMQLHRSWQRPRPISPRKHPGTKDAIALDGRHDSHQHAKVTLGYDEDEHHELGKVTEMTANVASGVSDKQVRRKRSEDNDVVDEKATQQTAQLNSKQTLICCGCQIREASLWCSSCFAVYCPSCWQSVHQTVVDASLQLGQSDGTNMQPLSRPLLGKNASFRPPIDMIYLPTRSLDRGKLQRTRVVAGTASTTRKVKKKYKQGNEDAPDAADMYSTDKELLQVASCPVLPRYSCSNRA